MLKYTFVATFKDGSQIKQTPEDKSELDPILRSSYYDVAQKGIENLKTFILNGGNHTYLVDLEDGHFEIDGIPFKLHEFPLKDFRLIYFRRHTHSFNRDTRKELSHDIAFRIGWQANNDKGENVQEVLEID